MGTDSVIRIELFLTAQSKSGEARQCVPLPFGLRSFYTIRLASGVHGNQIT